MANKRIQVPKNGWQESSYYWVLVKTSKNNVPHHAIFYTGFLHDDGTPAGYNCILNPTYDGIYENAYHKIYSMKIIRKLDTRKDNIRDLTKWEKTCD